MTSGRAELAVPQSAAPPRGVPQVPDFEGCESPNLGVKKYRRMRVIVSKLLFQIV
jgi:hypothetical protein